MCVCVPVCVWEGPDHGPHLDRSPVDRGGSRPTTTNGGENEGSEIIFINNGEECIFFESENIPRLDACPIETQNTISTSEF